MSYAGDQRINALLRQLDDEDQKERINAVTRPGETGDELCLKELRERLKMIHKEHLALIIPVSKLKKASGIK